MKKFIIYAALSFMVIGSVFAQNDKPSNSEKGSKSSTKKYNELIKANATDKLKQAYVEQANVEKELNSTRIEIMKSDEANVAVAEAYSKALNDMVPGKKDDAFKNTQREFEAVWKNNSKKYGQDQRLQAVMTKRDAARKSIESAEDDIRKSNPEAEKLWNANNDAKKSVKEAREAKQKSKKAEKVKKAEKPKKVETPRKVEKINEE